MRTALIVLLCLLVAVTVFMSWGDGTTPALPADTDSPSTTLAESPEGKAATHPNTNADAPTAAQDRIEVQPVTSEIPVGNDVARGRLLQNGRPLAFASIAVPGHSAARTDADGRFTVAIPAPNSYLEVGGDSVPRGVKIGPIVMSDMLVRELGDLRVPHSVSVGGRVVDEQGHARANVRVQATRDRFVDGLTHDDPKANLSALSRSDGSFRIDGLRPGEVKVRAVVTGYGSQRPSVNVSEGVGNVGIVVLLKREDLTGTIVDEDGQPLAGATVTPGGGSYPLQLHATVTTDENGRFTLIGNGKGWSLTIHKDGFAPRVLDSVYRLARPIRIKLTPANPVLGHVHGLDGAKAVFYIDTPKGQYRHIRDGTAPNSWTPNPVAESGAFSLPHLPEGKWTVRVEAPGKGSVAATPFDVPLQAKLELHLAPARRLELTVVNAAGAPIAQAEVRSFPGTIREKTFERPFALAQQWFRSVRHKSLEADERGQVTVAVPVEYDACFAVRAPMYMPTALGFPKENTPAKAMVTLQRAGFVVGRVDDADPVKNVAVTVTIMPVAKRGRLTARRELDAAGGFRAGPLLPGDYNIRVSLSDKTHFVNKELPPASPVPLIHDFDFVGQTTPVTVVAGEEVEVLVAMPKVGEIRGRVMTGGRPVAGAIVYAAEVEPKGKQRRSFGATRDGIDAHDYAPNCRTDEQGRYRFLVSAPKKVRIRARRETSGWCKPIELDVIRTSNVDLPDFLLPSSTIRGRLDLTTLQVKQRTNASAQLYPAKDAAADPFYHGDWITSLEWQSQRQDIGVTGEFAFEGVTPGAWVLRIMTDYQHIGLQREITIGPDDVVDLGQLQPPSLVQPQLRGQLPHTHGAWLRRVAAGHENGIYVTTLVSFTGEKDLPKLPVGKYLLQAFLRGPSYAGQWGVTGEAVGTPAEFVVHADGTTTPEVLWQNGF